ncbi:Trp biosynthesis-associated membrane protein [Agromyces archimandritae]|uniref:Trp biosynthesis-associated membrane protein n=1 Tax=Agromyces archimandritae TaxID=2781962 RepID=A0A975FMI6_9MICO|nr:Trp biosynthesis-associated membrane protein [Agromyces archimandritae]QTX04634.1 Trp biosynthesis-associated membrane protein [Agromyces archimandritae]
MLARAKSISLIAVIAAAGLGLLAWSQPWFTLVLDDGPWPADPVGVAGAIASPAVSALSIAGLALAAALALAGPVIRIVLGVLGLLLGGCLVLAAGMSLGEPATAVSRAVTEATGVAGTQTRDLIAAVDATAWPSVAIAAGILMAAASVFIVVTARRWPASARKYRTARFSEDVDDRSAKDRAVDDWDELTRGDDPTEPGGADEPPVTR